MNKPLTSSDNLAAASMEDLKRSMVHWTNMRNQPAFESFFDTSTKANINGHVTAIAAEIESRE